MNWEGVLAEHVLESGLCCRRLGTRRKRKVVNDLPEPFVLLWLNGNEFDPVERLSLPANLGPFDLNRSFLAGYSEFQADGGPADDVHVALQHAAAIGQIQDRPAVIATVLDR